jgi:hypothetical protein
MACEFRPAHKVAVGLSQASAAGVLVAYLGPQFRRITHPVGMAEAELVVAGLESGPLASDISLQESC